MHDTLAYAYVRSPKQMLTSGAISPTELAACSADRIAVQNGASNAYIADAPDQALQNASVPGGNVSTGTSLGGIPYALKDLFDVARVLTTADGVREATGNAVTRHSTFPNLTGHPAPSMPCGTHSACLPVSLQLVGRYFEEALLLRAAHAIERHDGFSIPLPDLRTLEKT